MMYKNFRRFLFLTVLLLSFSGSELSGQILTESFNDDSQIIKSHGFFTDGTGDYFGIFDPVGVAHDFDGFPTPPAGLPSYTGNTGLFLVGEDLDAIGNPLTQTLSWNNLDISDFTELNISVDVGVDANSFDPDDQVTFAVSIDGGAFVDIISISSPTTGGTATDGTILLSSNLQTITEDIVGTGSLLDLRLTVSANGSDEFAIDEIIINGTPVVICPHSVTGFAPLSGSVGTEVHINGTGFMASNTVDFDGVAASVQFVDATTLIATVPSGTTIGDINVTEADCTTSPPSNFTFFENPPSCTEVFSDLVMSEVYDENGGSLGFIELFNGTEAEIDLTDYRIDRYSSLTGTIPAYSYTFPASGIGSTIAVGEVLVGKVSSVSSTIQDFTFGGATGGYNSNDRLELVKLSTDALIDDFHDDVVEAAGFIYRRNTSITGPNPTYTTSEWTTATAGDVSGLGTFITIAPNSSIDTEPSDVMGCIIDFEVSATAGNGGALSYQWFYNENDGIATDWTAVSSADFPGATVIGETSINLIITGNLAAYNGYQFYASVAEDGECEVVSEVVQYRLDSDRFFRSVQSGNWSDATTWEIATSDAGPWSSACVPPMDTNSDYIHVLTGHTVTVAEDVIVENSELEIQEGGSVVISDGVELQINN